MKTKIHLLRVDDKVVVGFAKYGNFGLASAIIGTGNLTKREIEAKMTTRFHSQMHQLKLKGIKDSFGGFVFEWLNYDNVIGSSNHLLSCSSKPKIYSIEEKDGRFKVVKCESELLDEDEVKVELLKRMGL